MVTDAEGRILEFDLSGPNSVVNINEKTGENTIDVDRVVLIPLDQWSTDFITPASHCIKDPRYFALIRAMEPVFSYQRQLLS